MKRKGTVVQVTGPVVDVAFDGGSLPEINEALTVSPDGQPRMMEVAQHIGGDTVRCIMLAQSEYLARGMKVVATGFGIRVPVGEKTLGRMFNALGEPIDKSKPEAAWAVRVYHKPFVNWIWGGCLLMALGGALALTDRRYRARKDKA